MNLFKMNFQWYKTILLSIMFLSSPICFAEHGGGGFHQGGGEYHQNDGFNHNGGYHQNNEEHDNSNYNYVNPGVGHYYPGNGWGAPGVVIVPGNDSDCQTIQQCDSNGNCIQTQNCN